MVRILAGRIDNFVVDGHLDRPAMTRARPVERESFGSRRTEYTSKEVRVYAVAPPSALPLRRAASKFSVTALERPSLAYLHRAEQ